ncbi:MAG: hypothetical protein KA715_07910 [Xanthomonadaceae bacterium]|nr:hypothetical protein [Xanthomonadaceae bacterium]
MRINGDFGDEQGEVTVSNLPLANIVSWKPNQIIVGLPSTGPTSKGPVQVSVRGTKSNTVPITEWTGSFTLTNAWKKDYGAAGPQIRLSCNNLRFREDFHRYRPSIHSDPVWVNPHLSLASPERGSSCSWSWSGEGVDSSGNRTVISATGPTSALSILEAPDNGYTFGLLGYLQNSRFSFSGIGVYPQGRVVTTNPAGRVILDQIRTFSFNWDAFMAVTFPFDSTRGVFQINETKRIGDSGDPATQTLILNPTEIPNSDTES